MSAFKKAFAKVATVFSVADIRKKILFTVFIVVLFRFGSQIPVPFMNPAMVEGTFTAGILDFMNMLSGNALSQATLFALGISPYITSSIVMQLLCVAIPALERMSKDEDGKEKIQKITRFVTIGLALVMAIGYYLMLNNMSNAIVPIEGHSFFTAVVIIASYCAGASLVMWLGEKINQKGIGNGISIILFVNILVAFPSYLVKIFRAIGGKLTLANGSVQSMDHWWIGSIVGVLGLAFIIAMIAFMVFMSDSERRIPVQYAKRVVGRKMYGGQSSNLPLKVNMTGVMPIIFASSIVSIPATIAAFAGKTNATKGFWGFIANHFNQNSVLYTVLFLGLLLAFAYFYIAISFNPVEVSNNLRKNGGFVPGIRPGKPTCDYITRVLSKITFIGAICLMIVAGLPMIIGIFGSAFGYDATAMTYTDLYTLTYLAFSGNSLLIVIGVALETVRDIESQMTLRHFKGFLE